MPRVPATSDLHSAILGRSAVAQAFAFEPGFHDPFPAEQPPYFGRPEAEESFHLVAHREAIGIAHPRGDPECGGALALEVSAGVEQPSHLEPV